MRLSRKRKILVCIGIVAAVLYGLGYLHARREHWLVHRASYAHGKTATHEIAVGDLGLGWDARQLPARVSYIAFSPLRWLETVAWEIRHPTGQPWPYGLMP